MRLRFFQILALFSLSLSIVCAQTPPPGKGKEMIQKAIAALGGDHFLNMHTRYAEGRIYSFFHDQLSGLEIAQIYTQYDSEKPAKGLALREREVLGKHHDYSYLFLPDQAWDITFRGARPVPDESWERYQRTTENDILYLLKFRSDEPGIQYDYVGTDVYVSTHVEVVDITDTQDRAVRVYFDHNTMLPVRQSYSWLDPITRQHNDEITDFDKWRDVGAGIMWPFSIERQRNGYKAYQMFASKVEANQPLPDKIFDLPPGAKLLKKVD